jgi:hypothetical protein
MLDPAEPVDAVIAWQNSEVVDLVLSFNIAPVDRRRLLLPAGPLRSPESSAHGEGEDLPSMSYGATEAQSWCSGEWSFP